MIRAKMAAAGYQRTTSSIFNKRKRLKCTREKAGYSLRDLEGMFGVDVHCVMRWIQMGWLAPGERQGSRGNPQVVREADVKAFVFAHFDEVDLRKADKWWIADLLTDGKITR